MRATAGLPTRGPARVSKQARSAEHQCESAFWITQRGRLAAGPLLPDFHSSNARVGQDHRPWALRGAAAGYVSLMDHVAEAREAQWKAWERMTPAQRWALAARMSDQLLASRDGRLRRDHPLADAAELRRMRVAEVVDGYRW